MSRPLRRTGVTALSCLLVLGTATGVSAAGAPTVTPSTQRSTLSGTADNGCANPILATDLTGWSTADGDTGSRETTTGHILAGSELVVRPAGDRTVVHGPDRTVPGTGLWDLTFDLRTETGVAARVEATWYDADGGTLGRARGRWITVQPGVRYTRVGDRFLAPEHAARAQVAVAVDQRAAAPFALTMCSYRPVESPPTPVVVGTADHPAPTLPGGPAPTTPPSTTPPVDPAGPGTTPPGTPTTTPPTAPPTTIPAGPGTTVPVTTTPAVPTTTPPAATTTPTTPTTTAPITTTPATTAPTTTPVVSPTTTPGVPVGPEPPGGVPAAPLTAAERYGWGTPLPSSDEFDVPGAPDPARWVPAGECWPGHEGNGRRCASRATVTGGALVLDGLANGDTGWLAGRYGTQYGRWEARVRSYQTGTGVPYHPVMIVWPDSENWPADGEYDFLENSSPGEQCAEAFLHYPHPDLPVQQEFARETDCGAPLSEWHTLAFEWTPDHVRGYIDGEQWFSFSGGAGLGGRAAIQAMPSGHLTLQLDAYARGGLAPARFEVDWVRMYAI
jgi:hypothetical protein